jgi:hypothetical protein
MPQTKTRTEARLDDAIHAHSGDPERVLVLERARRFKRTWIELAEALVRVREDEVYHRWGYGSFDEYVTRELHLKRGTVDKLCASYGFLRANAPRLAHEGGARDDGDDYADMARAVPSWQAVDYVARAEERGAAPPEVLDEMKRAVFDDGAAAPALARRYREVAFPMDEGERRERHVAQLAAAGKRLVDLCAEPESGLPAGLGERVEAVVGELCAWVEKRRRGFAASGPS